MKCVSLTRVYRVPARLMRVQSVDDISSSAFTIYLRSVMADAEDGLVSLIHFHC